MEFLYKLQTNSKDTEKWKNVYSRQQILNDLPKLLDCRVAFYDMCLGF